MHNLHQAMPYVGDHNRAARAVGRSERIRWRRLRGKTQEASKTFSASISITSWSVKRDLLLSESLFLKMLVVRRRKAAQRKRSPTNAIYLANFAICMRNWEIIQQDHSSVTNMQECYMIHLITLLREFDYCVTSVQRPMSLEERQMLTIR
jgi:hypothetical protein